MEVLLVRIGLLSILVHRNQGQGAFDCGGNLTGPSGYIEAPDFDRDGNYDKDMFCVWQIEVPDGYVIVLDFLMMDITIGDCIYDFVQIWDNTGIFGVFCGSTLPALIQTSGSSMLIVFQSNYFSNSGPGFTLYYSQLDTCDIRLTFPIGTSEFDNRKTMVNGNKCIWIAKGASYQLVQLLITRMNIPSDVECETSYVKIYDENTLIGTYCRRRRPRLITSTSRQLRIELLTNKNPSEYQLTLIYGIIDNDFRCGGILTSSSGRIVSVDRSEVGGYDAWLVCVWAIVADFNHVVQIEFELMDIEESYKCERDFLKVNDGIDYEVTMRKLCGQYIPSPLRSTSNILMIQFLTESKILGRIAADGSISGAGFIIHYTHIEVIPSLPTSILTEITSTETKTTRLNKGITISTTGETTRNTEHTEYTFDLTTGIDVSTGVDVKSDSTSSDDSISVEPKTDTFITERLSISVNTENVTRKTATDTEVNMTRAQPLTTEQLKTATETTEQMTTVTETTEQMTTVTETTEQMTTVTETTEQMTTVTETTEQLETEITIPSTAAISTVSLSCRITRCLASLSILLLSYLL